MIPAMKGKQLRAIREHLGLTQTEMAEKIGVSMNTIARWERDEVVINETAAKLTLTFLDAEGFQKILVV